jgi:hypothetical protein
VLPETFSQTLLAPHPVVEVAGAAGSAAVVAALAAGAAVPAMVASAASDTARRMRFSFIGTSFHLLFIGK